MTGDAVRSFIAEAEHEISQGSGSSCYPAHGLLETAVALLKAAYPEAPAIPFDAIVAAYHKQLPMLAKVSKLTDQRRRQLARRWAEDKTRQSVAWWDSYFARSARSDFLTGARSNGRSDWKADFDFFLQPKSMIKIIEGAYGIAQARESTNDVFASVRHEQQRRMSGAR